MQGRRQGSLYRARQIGNVFNSYHFDIKDDHVFDVVVGQSIEKWGMGEDLEGSALNSIFYNDFDRAYLDNTKPIYNGMSGLNAVRNRAGLGNVAYSFEAIEKERRHELVFEGVR